jgi:hypothetical protein
MHEGKMSYKGNRVAPLCHGQLKKNRLRVQGGKLLKIEERKVKLGTWGG